MGTYAAAQVCAAIPNFLALEFHHLDNDVWSGLVEEGPHLIEGGHITVGDRPGLGLTLIEDAVRAGARQDLGFL